MVLGNPVRNPSVPPEQWHAYHVRRRWLLRLIGLVVLALGAGAGAFFMPRDRTGEMTAAEIVQAAGHGILNSDRYLFRAVLEGGGSSPDFPSAAMDGRYQREPLVLHLEGTATRGAQSVPLAYWLEGSTLYVRRPDSGDWQIVTGANLDELHSFQPDNIATPLLQGLLGAEIVGEERVGGKSAAVLDLRLDPKVMLPALGSQGSDYPSRVSYRLWVDKSALLPLRFRMEVAESGGESFTYTLEWTFRSAPALAVPEEIKSGARPG